MSVVVAVEAPIVRTRSVSLDGRDSEPLQPHRTLADGGLTVRWLPTPLEDTTRGHSGLAAFVNARSQVTRWEDPFVGTSFTVVYRVEADLAWARTFRTSRPPADEPGAAPLPKERWTPLLTLGGGLGGAWFEHWHNAGAHGEVAFGVIGPTTRTAPFVMARVGALLHPYGSYGRFDAGPTTNWSPSQVVVALDVGAHFGR